MLLNEARVYIGKVCEIVWHDRKGVEQSSVSPVYDVTFVPLYGGYLVTNSDDIRLDKIVRLAAVEASSVGVEKESIVRSRVAA